MFMSVTQNSLCIYILFCRGTSCAELRKRQAFVFLIEWFVAERVVLWVEEHRTAVLLFETCNEELDIIR